MAATTTKIGIWNRALQILGSQQIASVSENSTGAKAMSRAYDPVLLAELRANAWTFSITRASLTASVTAPIFGKARYFPLPGDFLYLAPNETTYCYPDRRDWQIEGLNIVSSDESPLQIRYVTSNITESTFDVLFAEALAAKLAMETCEEVTNSNTKLANAQAVYIEKIRLAKKRNAIEQAPVKSPVCSFITVRV